MLGISELYKELKFRVSNPLISSFIISWLFINWQIPIGIIFYKQSELQIDGFTSYFDLIHKSFTVYKYLYLPILFALIYTFIFPVLKNIINAFNTWAQKWGEELNIKISKDGSIPIEKYLELRESYKTQQDDLQLIIESESYTKHELDHLKVNYNELGIELETYKNALYSWEKACDVNRFNGLWEYTPNNSVLEKKNVQRVNINNGEIYFHYNRNEIHRETKRAIKWVYISPNSLDVTLLLEIFKSNGQGGEIKDGYSLQYLTSINSFSTLEGNEFGGNSIKYIRVSE